MMKITHKAQSAIQRGFALVIAVILTSVILSLGAALLDVAYKQVLLSSSSKNSQYAFYNSDSGLECALYFDQKFNAFSYDTPIPAGNVICDTRAVINYASNVSGGKRLTTFDLPCAGGGTSATVTAYKYDPLGGGTCDPATGAKSCIYVSGYSACDASLNTRIERGLKVEY